jgi:hypothetical protein
MNRQQQNGLRTKPLPTSKRPAPRSAGDYPCVVCSRDVDPAKARHVHLINGGGTVLHPGDDARYVPDSGDLCWLPIGPDCARQLGFEWSATLKS